jgi:hypothetical protein
MAGLKLSSAFLFAKNRFLRIPIESTAIGFVFLRPVGQNIIIKSFQILLYADLPLFKIGFVFSTSSLSTHSDLELRV